MLETQGFISSDKRLSYSARNRLNFENKWSLSDDIANQVQEQVKEVKEEKAKLPPLHDRALTGQSPKRRVWVDDEATDEEKTDRIRPSAEALSEGFQDSSEYSNERDAVQFSPSEESPSSSNDFALGI